MALDNQTLAQVARLARLQLNAEESTALTARLNTILALVDELKSADVGELTPMSHPLEITQPLRADTITAHDWRDAVFPHAPASSENYFLVPQVIE